MNPASAALCLALAGCSVPDVPPLPQDPDDWGALAEGVTWSGPLDAHWSAELSASRATGRWIDGGLDGRFDTLIIGLLPEGADVPYATATGRTARGRWPGGPLVLQDATWNIDDRVEGAAPTVTWTGSRWTCGGCPLESLAAEVATRGLDALETP